MNFNLGAVLSLLVAFQLSFMSLYLFANRKGNKRNNRLLALLFLMFAINLLDFTIRISGLMLPVPLWHLLDDCFFFLYGPVLYFYTMGVVYRDFALRRRDVIHLAPFIIVLCYLLFHVFFVDREIQADVAEQVISADLPAWMSLAGLIIYLHILTYLYFSWRMIRLYRKVLKDKFSSIDEISLDWLKFMIKAFFIIAIFGLLNSVLPVFGNPYFLYFSIAVLLIVSFLFINMVLVKALNQPEIFSGIEKAETEKYAMSGISEEQVNNYKKQLLQLMEVGQLYLQTDLKSKDLSDKLGISTKELSQVINQGFGKNFFDFVNTFRCEEVKRILHESDEKMTIIEAMYQSGFNSKSSFNKEFKKLTGQTPKEYRNSL